LHLFVAFILTCQKQLSVHKYLLRIAIPAILLLIPPAVRAQAWKSKPFALSISNHATLPVLETFSALVKPPLHPGIALTYEFGWKETLKNPMFRNINTIDLGGSRVYTGKWFQNAGISYHYHQHLQQAFALTTQAGYRRYIGKFSAQVSLHAGYLHSFRFTEHMVQDAGVWKETKTTGRSHLIAGGGFGIGYDAGYNYNTRRIFIHYDYRLQYPFDVNFAEPLPWGILSVGLQFTLFKNSGGKSGPSLKQLPCPVS